jgi:hypothetical protein
MGTWILRDSIEVTEEEVMQAHVDLVNRLVDVLRRHHSDRVAMAIIECLGVKRAETLIRELTG